MSEFDRRDFLKILGAGAGAAASTGCYRAAELPEQLIPYVVQPEDITPGLATIYASTCQECSAGCGLHVRTREGRPIKLEGNPEHPINQGRLCARGQASIGWTYHPDRYRGPQARGEGGLEGISLEEANAKLASAIQGAGGKVAVLGGEVGPTLGTLLDTFVGAVGGTRVVYDPFAPEALREAAKTVFGGEGDPVFDLSGTDYVIDFGGDALGTGRNSVEHAGQIMAARDAGKVSGRNARLVYVGPRLDVTAGSADEWLPAKPGSEGILALAIARAVADAKGGAGGLADSLLANHSPEAVADRAGVAAKTIRRIGRELAQAQRAVALPPGVALTSRRAVAANAAVLVLNSVIGAVGQSLILAPLPGGKAASFRDVVRLIDAMKSGEVSVLLVHGSNPVYSLPADSGFAEALEKVGTVVSFASLPDETSERAHLILPDHTSLESWGDSEPRAGVRSLVQPTVRPLFDTQALGDSLIAAAQTAGGALASAMPAGSFRSLLESAWADTNFRAALQRGGVFHSVTAPGQSIASSVSRLEFKEPQLEGDGEYVLLPVPSPLLGDGRGANLSWLQETPDPITKVAWQSWVEVSTTTADALGVEYGDVLAIQTKYGSADVPVWPRGGVRDDVVVLAIGQGHSVGRYASQGVEGGVRGASVNALLPSLTDESGGRAWLVAKASVSNTGRFQRLPFTQVTDNKRNRQLGESISLVALAKGENPWSVNAPPAFQLDHGPEVRSEFLAAAHGDGHGEEHGEDAGEHGDGHHDGPHKILREYDPVADSNADAPFRWGMTIDVDKCTGCSACVVACAIENNIPQVGEAGVLRSRQMSWLRIERYIGDGYQQLDVGRPGIQNHEALGSTDVRNSPMMCQQCGAGPCEPVCPVLATYHTENGLNGMIYNRCIGTRYCANNCPYKVRRFNWFDYQIEGWPEPMPLMLNPDVTVRGQGVMEKCTFCIQRLQEGRQDAKDAGRDLPLDGSIQTACQQTCPTNAISFGNLKDADAAIHTIDEDNAGRAYRALHVLNTRPAINYLAKVKRTEHGDAAHHAAVSIDSIDPTDSTDASEKTV
jgi:molybdopterin-containing oxidoreductase family iron-sulfur binding subunit